MPDNFPENIPPVTDTLPGDDKNCEPLEKVIDAYRLQTTSLAAGETKKGVPKTIEKIPNTSLQIEVYTSMELTPEVILETSRAYRYFFTNSFPYEQGIFYPSARIAISPKKIPAFQTFQGYIPLEIWDNFDLSSFPHPETGEIPMFWFDPETTFQNFQHKLAADAHVTLIRDTITGKIMGETFGHECSVLEEFITEEWQNPVYYSKLQDPQYYRDFSTFISKVNKALSEHGVNFNNLQLDPATKVYAWNAIAVDEEITKKHPTLALNMAQSFFRSIPDDMKNRLLVLGETLYDTKPYKMFRVAGAIPVPGILTATGEVKKGEPIIILGPLRYSAQVLSMHPRDFIRLKNRLGIK